jgi:hypothetical protein
MIEENFTRVRDSEGAGALNVVVGWVERTSTDAMHVIQTPLPRTVIMLDLNAW